MCRGARGEEGREKRTHLYPAPDGGEEGRGVDDGYGAERLGVVGGREGGSFLEVRAERPEEGERDLVEVDNSGDRGDGRGCSAVREGGTEAEDKEGHCLVEGDAGVPGKLHGGRSGTAGWRGDVSAGGPRGRGMTVGRGGKEGVVEKGRLTCVGSGVREERQRAPSEVEW